MRWRKLGLVAAPLGSSQWQRTHSMLPVPVKIADESIRVYVSCLDAEGRGQPAWVDVSAENPTKVIDQANAPLLRLGRPGTFDDNGVVATSIVEVAPGLTYMYYVGFELCTRIRYRLLTGLAISRDNGVTFHKHGSTPVLERSDSEAFFRCGPHVRYEGGKFRLWYVAGSEWTDVLGKQAPVYDLRYAESEDGITWPPEGKVIMALGPNEHGFGRPWIVRKAEFDYELYYSIRSSSHGTYGLGYARSVDGLTWVRQDHEMGLGPTPGNFDSRALSYSSVIDVNGRTFCFYNGDEFGRAGFGVAELIG